MIIYDRKERRKIIFFADEISAMPIIISSVKLVEAARSATWVEF
jgi:hypothetical protein